MTISPDAETVPRSLMVKFEKDKKLLIVVASCFFYLVFFDRTFQRIATYFCKFSNNFAIRKVTILDDKLISRFAITFKGIKPDRKQGIFKFSIIMSITFYAKAIARTFIFEIQFCLEVIIRITC